MLPDKAKRSERLEASNGLTEGSLQLAHRHVEQKEAHRVRNRDKEELLQNGPGWGAAAKDHPREPTEQGRAYKLAGGKRERTRVGGCLLERELAVSCAYRTAHEPSADDQTQSRRVHQGMVTAARGAEKLGPHRPARPTTLATTYSARCG